MIKVFVVLFLLFLGVLGSYKFFVESTSRQKLSFVKGLAICVGCATIATLFLSFIVLIF